MTTLADQLAALTQMEPAQLRTEWRRLYQTPPSPRLTTDLLRRGIAYKLQERVHGGLPSHIARELDRLAKRRLADTAAAAAAAAVAAATAGAEGGDAGAEGRAQNALAPRRIEEPRLRPGTAVGLSRVSKALAFCFRAKARSRSYSFPAAAKAAAQEGSPMSAPPKVRLCCVTSLGR